VKRDWHITDRRREWLLKRNCSLTPRQTMASWAALVTLSLAVGLVCAWNGAPLVLLFTALEITAVTAAFVLYSRHATDFDRIVLEEGHLTVDQVRAGRTQQYQLETVWLRVTPMAQLSARDVTVDVGSFLPKAQRQALARELRLALAA